MTMSIYQDQLNAGFSKVCEKFKVHGIESLKYVREFYTPVCYCGGISTPLNMTRHKTKCDWLLYLSVIWPLGQAFAIQSGQSSQTFSYARLYWPRINTSACFELYMLIPVSCQNEFTGIFEKVLFTHDLLMVIYQ